MVTNATFVEYLSLHFMSLLVIVLGTRPEALKCVPVLTELEKLGIDYTIILTGQHEVKDILRNYRIKEDRIVLLKSFNKVGYNISTGLIRLPALVTELKQVIRSLGCKHIIFHGDTATSVATALASSKSKVEAIHIEAGLRSGSLFEPIPEEFFRRVADRHSDILFAPSMNAMNNLKRDKVKGKIIYSGNTVCDLLQASVGENPIDVSEHFYAVVTIHRYENIFVLRRMRKIMSILSIPRMPLYWVMHPSTERQLKRFRLFQSCSNTNIKILPPLTYHSFINLLNRCQYVITDSGSLEEECLILNKPCVLLRRRTERGEGIPLGVTFLTRLDFALSESVIHKLESGNFTCRKYKNPYALLGSPTKIIVDYLLRFCDLK